MKNFCALQAMQQNREKKKLGQCPSILKQQGAFLDFFPLGLILLVYPLNEVLIT